MPEMCDVCIVGGGPAGSSCAWALRDSGLDVLILDRAEFPREKVCAGWITPQVIESLQLDLEDYARGRTFQPISAFEVGVLGQNGIRIDFGTPVSYGIRRFEFDDYLLARCGARTLHSTPVRTLQRTDAGWVINEEIHCRLLVGAGGHFCPVARWLRAQSRNSAPLVTAQEAEFLLPPALQTPAVAPEIPQLYFSDDLAGYGWCFRKGDYLNVGLGLVDSRQTSARLPEVLQTLVTSYPELKQLTPRYHGHAYHLHAGEPMPLVADRLMLIGDAAGLAYPESGEGIRPAVESGMLAAGTIKQCQDSFSTVELQAYQDAIERRFGRPQPARAPQWWNRLPASWRKWTVRRLLRSRWFVRQVILKDWFLHNSQPPLPLSAVAAGAAEGQSLRPV